MVWANWLIKFGSLAKTFIRAYCQLVGKPLIEVNYNCGFGNQLTLRGELPGLSWEKGAPMTNTGPSSWIWIAPTVCTGPFKILINDQIYEEGPNHHLENTHGITLTPTFTEEG